MKKSLLIVASMVLGAGILLAHPHFDKTIVVKLPGGVEATINYNTTPMKCMRKRRRSGLSSPPVARG